MSPLPSSSDHSSFPMIPAAILAVTSLGICVSALFTTSFLSSAVILGCGVIMILFSLILHKNLRFLDKAAYSLTISLLTSFFAVGMITENFNRTQTSPPPTDKDGFLTACVLSEKTKTTGNQILLSFLRPDLSNSGVKGYAVINGIQPEPGNILKFEGKLSPVTIDSVNINFNRYLLKQGVSWKITVQNNTLKFIGNRTTPSSIAHKIRTEIEIFIENSELSKQTASFLITVLLGDNEFMDSALRQNFADAGVSHALALSGMHVGIIVMILMYLFLPLNFTGNYRLRYYLTFISLWGYAFITGFSPTIVRATLMTSFAFIAILLQRKNSSFNALCFATLLIILITPEALFTTSLQLSFICVASIIIFSEKLNTISLPDHPVLYKFNTLVICSLVTTFSTWMLTAYAFGSVPFMFLPANIVLLPVLPFYLAASIIYLSLSAIGIHLSFFALILDKTFHFTMSVLEFISGSGKAVMHIIPSLHAVVLWLIGTALLAFAVHSSTRRNLLLTISCSTLILSLYLI